MDISQIIRNMIKKDIEEMNNRYETIKLEVDLKLLEKLNNIKKEDIKIEDWGGSCPRQIMFYLGDIEIGYLRVRYGSATLYASTFNKENGKVVFKNDYSCVIYTDDFGDFGDGDFIDNKQEENIIKSCIKELLDFYHSYDTKYVTYLKERKVKGE